MKKIQKEKIKYLVIVVGSVSAICLVVFFFIVGMLRLFRNETKAEPVISYQYRSVEKPEVKERLLTVNENSRPGTPLEEVNGVVIHYTANPNTTAYANRNYFESKKDCADESQNKVSSHYIIGLDGTIVQCIPEEEIAYASNERNSDTISIECCHPDSSGKFNRETYRSLVQLTGYLCVKYQLSEDDIIRHYDITKKLCPKYYVEHPQKWKKLKKDIWKSITK